MPISLLPQFFFISLLLICSTNFSYAYKQCTSDQKTLLLDFKNELKFNPSNSQKLVRWNQTDNCCSWEGVECDGFGHVISLQLDYEFIYGELESSSSLFSLRYLKKLNLAQNEFYNAQIPRGIGNLTYLTHLDLSDAGFGGQIPIELSLLTRLVSLHLSDNVQALKLEYPDLGMVLRNLSGLKELYLDGFDLSTDKIEWYDIISSSLPNLRNLSLYNCGLSSPPDPSLLKLQSLTFLDLSWNNLSTVVPNFFVNFSSLTFLNLRDCSLKGSLDSVEFGSNSSMFSRPLSNLIYLDLASNSLSGSIPQSLFGLPSLQALYLFNNQFSGRRHEFSTLNFSNIKILDLRSNQLEGPIPKSFFQLESIEILYLSYNQFSGRLHEFPTLNFSNIKELDLSYNRLEGPIPMSFFRLENIEILDLSNNQFSGRLHEFSTLNFANIKSLDLSSNQLEGPIPDSFFQLESIETLDLSNNQFSGQVHEFPTLNFSNIQELDLDNNRLEGPIPESFFQLESIQYLDLSDNLFNGTFQLEKIQKLSNLIVLVLSDNKNLSVDARTTNSSLSTYPDLADLRLASCNLYYFPDFIKQFQTLKRLDLSNNRIAGEIPSWIWDIGNGTLSQLNLSSNLLVDLQKPYKIPDSLMFLDLHSNNLQGELPLPPQRAYYVDYSNNNFVNSIPPNFGNFTSTLQFFSLKNNSMSGSIPPSLCNSLSLLVLDLSLNKLTGNIPPCLLESTEYLQVLNLERNNISGYIPDKFSVNCRLTTLELSHNNLTGDIPFSLASCKSLVVMNVGNNNINDTFPCMLSSSLRILVLRSNRFYGEVGCHDSFPNLQIIDIASNNFNGTLHPKSFSTWRGMMAVNDAQLEHNRSELKVLKGDLYQNEVTLTIKGLELKLVKIWPDFTSIDFSCNNFKGEIPKAIGDLTLLYLLNLSHNALTGAIPKSLGKLAELGSLDLSENELTGVIPMELARISFLSVLNVSYNKLVGEIPIGPQFQTFSSDSFEGNMGLCGKPTNISCRKTEEGSVELEEKTMEIEWEYVSIVLGFVVGLGSFVWVLFGCMRFRDIYFHKIEEILEKILVRHKSRRRRRHGRRTSVRRRR